MNIVSEATAKASLHDAIQSLHEYVNHNAYNVDHRMIAGVLRENGYVEPVHTSRFFRAMSHETANLHGTIGEFYEQIKDGRLMRMGEPQGCCTNSEGAFNFLAGEIHMNDYHDVWPEHRMHSPINSMNRIYIVYEISARAEDILWSMRGLRQFAQSAEPAIAKAIREVLAEYEYDDEVMLDTRDAGVIGTELYDSEEHEEEYNE